jgi:hypothetical protein
MMTTEIKVLRKMFDYGYIGAKHTSADNIPKGFPKHERGEVKEALKKLVKKGLVNSHPTSYGMEVSLNSARIGEIRALLGLP